MTIDRRLVLAGGVSTAFHLLAGPVRAQGRDATPQGFAGRAFVNERGGLRIHTYVGPPQGGLVTTHVVETPVGLVVVDGQFVAAAAQEAKRYVDSIGKPVLRYVLSHQHPDHWFGFHHWGRVGVHAGPATAAFLRQNGAALIAERRVESSVPEIAGVLSAGSETIGGVEFRFRPVMNTEAPEIVVVEAPAAGATIVQDLVYNKVHAVVSRQIDEWVAALRAIEAAGGTLPLVLPGHGEPAGIADLPRLVAYLEAVKPMIAANIGKESEAPAIVAEMSRRFPDHRLPPLLQLGLARALRG
jgi:glyoxylase-like metal-dependent hydrolase (beta-lactamase superfamily II)